MADGAAPHPALRETDRLVVDAMNVIGSRPDGWWHDRDAAVVGFVDRLRAFAATVDAEVVVVVDGHPIEGLPEGRHGQVELHYAPRRGPDAADDRIVELLGERQAGREQVTVVTADRELRERVRALDADVIGPQQLLAAIEDGHGREDG